MKFKLEVDSMVLDGIFDALNEADAQGADNLSLVITGKTYKDKDPVIDNIQLTGECTTEYVHDIK